VTAQVRTFRCYPMALIACLLFASCQERSVEKTRYGRFVYEAHTVSSYLTFSTQEKTVFCRDDGAMCIEGKLLTVDDSASKWLIAVYDEAHLMFFDSALGIKVACDTDPFPAFQYSAGGYWIANNYVILSRKSDDFSKNSPARLDLFSIVQGRCLRKKLKHQETSDYTYSGFSQPEDGGGLAWIWCAPECRLEWMLPDDTELHSEDIGCPKESLLNVEWIDGLPQPRHQVNYGDQACLDENGRLKYP
jgi:hypothetical protein